MGEIEVVSKGIVAEYDKELSEGQEAVVQAVVTDLNDCGISDEIVRARVLAQHKSFALKVYVASVKARKKE